ncbi:MAG: hypothetical protein GX256_05290 [Fretibacterium sp.]|nr:hypothetical protein [Fretibacterium sp.]
MMEMQALVQTSVWTPGYLLQQGIMLVLWCGLLRLFWLEVSALFKKGASESESARSASSPKRKLGRPATGDVLILRRKTRSPAKAFRRHA